MMLAIPVNQVHPEVLAQWVTLVHQVQRCPANVVKRVFQVPLVFRVHTVQQVRKANQVELHLRH